MSALRVARAFTKRDRILKTAGGYHGHADALLASAGSGLATLGIPASPGVPTGAAADTIVVPHNDMDAVAEAVMRHGEGLAAIVVEPVAANMGVVPPEPGYLETLRRLCDGSGALLVFDEVITGFRVARGGAQERYGVLPDLTVLGKIVGGGLPLAAFGRVQRVGALLTLFMTDRPVRNFEDALACDTERYAALFRHLLEQGVYLPPSQFEALFPSTAHGEEEIERTVVAVESFAR